MSKNTLQKSGRLPKKKDKREDSVKRYLAIYEELKREIISGEIRPGESLLELELARRFGISRVPIREALMHLHKEGLLNATPYKGYAVPELSLQGIRNLYQVRLIMECAASELAAQHSPKSQKAIAEMEQNVRIHQLGHDPNEPLRCINAEVGFHMAIARASGNILLEKFIEETWTQFQRFYIKIISFQTKIHEVTIREHVNILAEIKNQNPQKARDLMYQHILGGRERALELYFSDNRVL